MKIRTLVVALIAFVFGIIFAAYPNKLITYVICFAPGGESDITARLQQLYLEKYSVCPSL